jgi:hypothetical protein
MVISFNVDRVLNYLVKYGEVYTIRKWRKGKIGKDHYTKDLNQYEHGDILGDCFIEYVKPITNKDDLQPYYKKSGFNSADEWYELALKLMKSKSMHLYHIRKIKHL